MESLSLKKIAGLSAIPFSAHSSLYPWFRQSGIEDIGDFGEKEEPPSYVSLQCKET